MMLELRSGAESSIELYREHQMGASMLADWKTIFLAHAAAIFEQPDQRRSEDDIRIAGSERLKLYFLSLEFRK